MINVKKPLDNPYKKHNDNDASFWYERPIVQKITPAAKRSAFSRGFIALLIGASSVNGYAAILSDNSNRSIEMRANNANTDVSYPYIKRAVQKSDRIHDLIKQKQREYPFDSGSAIDDYAMTTGMDYQLWLNGNRYRATQVANYQRYLNSQLGTQNVPPLDQLLTTARSWERCGYEPYQLPPQELWSNIVPTLRLYNHLKIQGVLPANTEIRSVYRNPDLNDCAGGASGSKHMTGGAMDIWVPEYDDNKWLISSLQNRLCEFWQYQGGMYEFGLGLYPTGAIHLDTQGYRKWGVNYADNSSSCRD